MNPRIILDPTVYVHSRTPLYKTLQWRFPKIGGTSKSSMLVSDLPWNKHFSINHPAIEVPPWLWTPPLIVPSRGCPSLSIDLTSAFDVDAWIHGFKPTESQKNPRNPGFFIGCIHFRASLLSGLWMNIVGMNYLSYVGIYSAVHSPTTGFRFKILPKMGTVWVKMLVPKTMADVTDVSQ